MSSQQLGIPIVLACDEAYAMPLATALRSIVENNRNNWPLYIYILTDSFSEWTKSKILQSLDEGSVSLNWVQVDSELFSGFSTLNHVSKMTYARLLIPNAFPDNVSRVLYLDADILVIDDLTDLFRTDLKDTALGAVLDRAEPWLKANKPSVNKVPRVQQYFNAGVLYINLDYWRNEQISEKALAYLHQNPQTPYSDQDALNFACDGLWKRLDERWNFQDHLMTEISGLQAEKRPAIVHFITAAKPWNYNIPNINAKFYDAFRSRTRFARTYITKIRDQILEIKALVKNHFRKYQFLIYIWTKIKPFVRR